MRNALYDWMSGVLRNNGWTAAEWARRAAVTPSNLTRFLRNPAIGSVPGTETIGRLAQAAGTEPRFVSGGLENRVWRVPLLGAEDLEPLLSMDRLEAQDYLRSVTQVSENCVLLAERPSLRAFAVRITSHHLNAGGVILDDRVVLEPPDLVPPRVGDLVVVLEDRSVCAYRFYPPYLVPVSTDSACVPMRSDDARVIGVGTHIVRPLRP
ncbi:MAG TPA: XRE family transcriptional regulator [Alphaproteobacteria bacterium]|nr:XRE family transcriptional regulator [Alphaproteobacteria bacterium]